MTLDPNHWKNDDARRLRIGIDITTAARRAMPFWKLHDDSHAPSSPEKAARAVTPADGSVDATIKDPPWLTVR
jgi:hypothetical protein